MGGKAKNHLNKSLRDFAKQIKTWHLFLALIPLLFLTATFFRLDHITMTKLRDEVLAADTSGDKEALKKSLSELRDFVFSHTVLNIIEDNGETKLEFGTGVFYLEETYHRDANSAIESAEKNLSSDANPNGNIFIAASNVCKPIARKNGWAWNDEGYLNCMTGELAKYPTSDSLTDIYLADVPSTELYRYEYVSPIWSPTFSGFLTILCALLIVVILTRFLIWLILKIALIFI